MGSDLALFRRFPGLRDLPRVPFVEVPTPVETLGLRGVAPDALWVKRDDRSCALYGGNKPRKLEFVIGAACARGARRLVTTGALGTHHGLATTILAARAGLATTLVLVDQPVDAHVREQLLLMAAHGAEIVHGRNVAGTALQVSRVMARATLRGERPELVAVGGSSPLGNVGFVAAAFELAEQVATGALPEPRELYVPVGSGGTLAGLVLGGKLLGWRLRPVGVLVTDILPPSPRRLARLAQATWRRMRAADAALPEVALGPEDFCVATSQLGAGYGRPTPAARAAAARAAAAGLALETTYSAKCLAEVLARLEAGVGSQPCLFWNTFNGVDLSAGLPAAVPESLPRSIRELLAAGSP